MMDTDIGVMQIEAKEHQELQGPQEAGRGKEESFPWNLQGECGFTDILI